MRELLGIGLLLFTLCYYLHGIESPEFLPFGRPIVVITITIIMNVIILMFNYNNYTWYYK
jgi:hypothetical protein